MGIVRSVCVMRATRLSMLVAMSRCANATWKGHVSGHHSTIYGVVRLDLVLR